MTQTDPDAEPRDTITIVIRLPQPVEAVSRVLRAVADQWPAASLDFRGPWRIEIPPDGGPI